MVSPSRQRSLSWSAQTNLGHHSNLLKSQQYRAARHTQAEGWSMMEVKLGVDRHGVRRGMPAGRDHGFVMAGPGRGVASGSAGGSDGCA